MQTFYVFWQMTFGLVQNILGLFLYLVLPSRGKFRFHGAYVTKWHRSDSMTLGMFIFYGHNNERVLVHEFGHTIQSMVLGPLYLLVIGIPSVLWATLPYFENLRKEKGLSYYSLYCESWATDLGDTVIRHNIL